MRVLFLLGGTIWIHTLPEGFIDAGHEVEVAGPLTKEKLPEQIAQFRPHMAISIGWGPEQTTASQLLIRTCVKEAKVPHVYWSIEDPAFTQIFSLPLIKNMQPDFVFSQSALTAKEFRSMGIPSEHMDFGYAPKIHCHVPEEEEYKSEISIVANAYPDVLSSQPNHYRHHAIHTLLTSLLEEKIRINFWGRDWDKVLDYVGYEIPQEWIKGYLPYKDANRVYSASTIMLGLQNYPDQVTQRTYEVLASRGFLITCDTPGVRKLFTPGKDLQVSSSPQQTLELVKYYLSRPTECEAISQAGEKSVAGHSYKERAEYMVRVLCAEGILKSSLI